MSGSDDGPLGAFIVHVFGHDTAVGAGNDQLDAVDRAEVGGVGHRPIAVRQGCDRRLRVVDNTTDEEVTGRAAEAARCAVGFENARPDHGLAAASPLVHTATKPPSARLVIAGS